MSYTTTWEEITSHYRVKDREFPMLADDMPTFMGVPHATTPDDLAGADVVIIGAPYVAGAKGKVALTEGDVDYGIWTSGMVQGLINDIPTVKELIDGIISDAESIIHGRLDRMTV